MFSKKINIRYWNYFTIHKQNGTTLINCRLWKDTNMAHDGSSYEKNQVGCVSSLETILHL